MPKEFDVREHGVLFALVEWYDKALEFLALVPDLFSGSLDIEIIRGQPHEWAPPPVLFLEEQPNWSIWVFPKGRPKYEQAYWDLEGKLGHLARLMVWPTYKYPLEVISCEGGKDAEL